MCCCWILFCQNETCRYFWSMFIWFWRGWCFAMFCWRYFGCCRFFWIYALGWGETKSQRKNGRGGTQLGAEKFGSQLLRLWFNEWLWLWFRFNGVWSILKLLKKQVNQLGQASTCSKRIVWVYPDVLLLDKLILFFSWNECMNAEIILKVTTDHVLSTIALP